MSGTPLAKMTSRPNIDRLLSPRSPKLMNRPTFVLASMLALGAMLWTGCGSNADMNPQASEAQTEAEAETHESEEILLTAEQMEQAQLEVAAVTSSVLRSSFIVPGRVVSSLRGSAHVGVLVSGRVVSLMVDEGATVRRGQALAEVESFEVVRLKAEYHEAHARLEQATSALERETQLVAEKLAPERELEEAASAHHTAEAVVHAAASKLSALGVLPESIAENTELEGGRMTVRAPISGTVTARLVKLGEFVEPSDDLFETAAEASTLIEAQVPTASIDVLHIGSVGTVEAENQTTFQARVVSVAPIVSSESRTVEVRLELSQGALRPETFVDVRFETTGAREALVLPASAVDREGSSAYVYVQESPGKFHLAEIDIASETDGFVEVSAGLEAGQVVAVSGVFYLRSARQKGELAEHGH
jgi:membrane fusion protein, heavy metal efflux system